MRWSLAIASASLVFAQAGGTEPKPRAEDYESHGQAGHLAIGAEYTIHSFSGQGKTFFVNDFLVVEVALYPPKGEKVHVNEGAFALRINGKRQVLVPSPPSVVASALQHPDWQPGPRLEGGVGAGPADVIFGRPRSTQVPGGQPPRMPAPPRVPDAEPPGGLAHEPPVKAEELAVGTALPEGDFPGAVSGFLYFAYKGKATSIKSVDLLYEDAVLKLR